MTEAFKRLFLILIGWLQPTRRAARARRNRDVALRVEETGRFYFRRNILDQLDDYMKMIRSMKRADPEGYTLYSKVGAHILCQKWEAYRGDLGAAWRAGSRPGFGALAYLFDDWEEKKDYRIGVKFAYFHKLDRSPAYVQRSNGDVYALTLLYVDKKKPKYTCAVRCHVGIPRDAASVTLLREMRVSRRWIHSKRHGDFWVPDTSWIQPLDFIARDNKIDVDVLATETFATLIQMHELANGDVRIRAERDGLVAAFSVDLLRTPYFFKDRDVDISIDGHRRKIFHIVRTHERQIGSRSIFVKSHFRGERAFVWRGFNITITMPGLHHKDLLTFDLAAHDVPKEEKTPGMVGIDRLAEAVDRHIHR